MDLTDEDVRAILKVLETSPFGDLQLETTEFRLTLHRTGGGGWTRESATLRSPQLLQSAHAPGSAPPPGSAAAVAAAHGAVPAAATTPATGEPTAAPRSDVVDARTPLPGTFYRSPKPGVPPFVELGATVATDTVIAIVETMKLMNSIYAGAAGRVVEICTDDGAPVAQDAVLMRIATDPP